MQQRRRKKRATLSDPSPGIAQPQKHREGRQGNRFIQDQIQNAQQVQQQQPGRDVQWGAAAGSSTELQRTPEDVEQESVVWQMGWEHGLLQADTGLDNIARDVETRLALAKASESTGVNEDDLVAMAIIESSGNRSVGTNAFGYTGLMQMGRDAATDIGMPYESLVGAENVENNALAGARYSEMNSQRMETEVPRDPLHLYLAHQQGASGASDLYETVQSNPDAQAHSNMRNNLPETVLQKVGWDPSYQEFYDYWSGKMAAIQSLLAEQRSQEEDAP
jgi:hypothetical protein